MPRHHTSVTRLRLVVRQQENQDRRLPVYLPPAFTPYHRLPEDVPGPARAVVPSLPRIPAVHVLHAVPWCRSRNQARSSSRCLAACAFGPRAMPIWTAPSYAVHVLPCRTATSHRPARTHARRCSPAVHFVRVVVAVRALLLCVSAIWISDSRMSH